MHIDFNASKMDNELLSDPEAFGYLNYLSLSSRPDVMCVSPILSAYSQKPTKLGWQAVTKVFVYLLGTSNQGLFYEFNSTDDK
jgi:hypothetical protein